MEGIDLSKELQDFYENNKHEKIIRNLDETLKDAKSGFFKLGLLKNKVIDYRMEGEEQVFKFFLENNNLIFSIKKCIYCFNSFFLIKGSLLHKNSSESFLKVDYSDLNSIEKITENNKMNKEDEEDNVFIKSKKVNFKGPDSLFVLRIKKDKTKNDIRWNKSFLFNEVFSIIEIPFNKLNKIKGLKLKEELRLQEEQRLKELQISQTNVLSELDKDGNGEVDVVEGNDFNTLLKKHQKSIVEVDRTYVQQFVKVSSYLKTKKGNIQSIFNSIKDTPNQELLNEYVEILKDDIHTYNLILFNSLNMIVSLVEDDMITFYEIHEMFDTLNMFDSKHEKDVSQKLTNIGDGLKDLMYEVRRMGNKISNSIQELSYVTEESNRQLTNQLSEIDSTMKAGNLINTINTYQNYKTNRRLNS